MGHGAALGQSVPDSAQDAHLVLFELHAGTAAIAEAPACQRFLDGRGAYFDARRDALNNSDECRPMGLTGGQPTQHGFNTAMSR